MKTASQVLQDINSIERTIYCYQREYDSKEINRGKRTNAVYLGHKEYMTLKNGTQLRPHRYCDYPSNGITDEIFGLHAIRVNMESHIHVSYINTLV